MQLLRGLAIPPELFQAGGDSELQQDLLAMKVVELRAALEARGEAVSGNKAWLRRRLHTAVVQAYLAVAQRPRRITGFSEHAYTFNTYQTCNVLNEI